MVEVCDRMSFQIRCECGRTLDVGAADCGQNVACACGKSVKVPRLSELRQSAGLDPYASGIVDKIRGKIAKGELPAEHECLSCYRVTEAKALFSVECERPYRLGTGATSFGLQVLGTAVLLVFFPIIALLRAVYRQRQDPTIVGREVAVDVPLRCCEACSASRRISARRAKQFMAETEPYRELFKQYPRAKVRRV